MCVGGAVWEGLGWALGGLSEGLSGLCAGLGEALALAGALTLLWVMVTWVVRSRGMRLLFLLSSVCGTPSALPLRRDATKPQLSLKPSTSAPASASASLNDSSPTIRAETVESLFCSSVAGGWLLCGEEAHQALENKTLVGSFVHLRLNFTSLLQCRVACSWFDKKAVVNVGECDETLARLSCRDVRLTCSSPSPSHTTSSPPSSTSKSQGSGLGIGLGTAAGVLVLVGLVCVGRKVQQGRRRRQRAAMGVGQIFYAPLAPPAPVPPAARRSGGRSRTPSSLRRRQNAAAAANARKTAAALASQQKALLAKANANKLKRSSSGSSSSAGPSFRVQKRKTNPRLAALRRQGSPIPFRLSPKHTRSGTPY